MSEKMYFRSALNGVIPVFPVVERETTKYVDFLSPYSFTFNKKDTTRETKFLCVGGPFDGEYWTRTQLKHACPGYMEFNNAGGSRHKVVFVWNTEER